MRRLFTQDSESPRSLRQLVVLVALVMVALVASDWLLGRVLPRITTESPFILRPVNVPGVEALWRMSEAGVQPVVFTGSSQVYTGISPHLFDAQIKARTGKDIQAVNASVLGAVVEVQRDLIENLFIPKGAKIILYGIEMRAVKAESLREDSYLLADFKNKALGYAVSNAAPLERSVLLWLLEHSNWVRYRDNLNDWLTGERLIDDKAFVASAEVDDVGYAPFPNTYTQDTTNITTQFIPFSANDEARQMLAEIATTCRQNGVQCILLNMPMHDAAYTLISAEEEAQYRQMIEAAGLPIWDFNTEACRQALGDLSFFNVNHLNTMGAEKFTPIVADVYAHEFYDVPVEGDAACAVITP